MRIRVQLFAAARQIVGCEELELIVSDGATIAEIESALLAAVPALENIIVSARWAVDAEFVDDDRQVMERAEIALIPPVSGG